MEIANYELVDETLIFAGIRRHIDAASPRNRYGYDIPPGHRSRQYEVPPRLRSRQYEPPVRHRSRQYEPPVRHRSRQYEPPPRHRIRQSEISPHYRPLHTNGGSFMVTYDFYEERDLLDALVLSENIARRNVSGLSKESISKYLMDCSFDVTRTDEDICTICQDKVHMNEEVTTLSCSHIFHMHCITEWLLIKNDCPVCRALAIPNIVS